MQVGVKATGSATVTMQKNNNNGEVLRRPKSNQNLTRKENYGPISRMTGGASTKKEASLALLRGGGLVDRPIRAKKCSGCTDWWIFLGPVFAAGSEV